jgi:hypothetical protein
MLVATPLPKFIDSPVEERRVISARISTYRAVKRAVTGSGN